MYKGYNNLVGVSVTKENQELEQHIRELTGKLSQYEAEIDSLRAGERLFSDFFKDSPVAFFLSEIDSGAILKCNEAASHLSGYSQTELTTLKLHDIFIDSSEPPIAFENIFSHLKKCTKPNGIDIKLKRADNTLSWVCLFAQPICNEKKECKNFKLVVFDISDRKRIEELEARVRQKTEERNKIEEALREEHQQLLSIFDSINESVYISDPETYEIIFVNNRVRKEFGLVEGEKCHKVFHDLDVPCYFCTNKYILGDNEGETYNWEFQDPRTHRWRHCINKAIRWPDGRLVRYEMGIDITEQRIIEEKFIESQHFLQAVIDGITESIMVIDTDYRILMINKSARDLHFGDNVLDEHYCYQVTHQFDEPCSSSEHPCPLKGVLKTKEPCTVVHRHVTKNGALYPVEITASPIFNSQGEIAGVIEVGRDITERLQLEEEMRELEKRLFQEQKEQSIATLAGGIAHDFNNILTVVIGYAKLLQSQVESASEVREKADIIENSAQRMVDLTSKLLSYAKGGKYHPRNLYLHTLIADSLEEAAENKGTDNIVIHEEVAADLWAIVADPNQMRQMLTNLFMNAYEAMGEDGGVLKIKVKNVRRTEEWSCENHCTHPAGDYIYLRISDSGPGIPENIKEKVFDPFFSTKFVGRGLGLSATMGIVQNHGGCITIDSLPYDGGATIHIYLPKAEIELPSSFEDKNLQERGEYSGDFSEEKEKKSILVVDDEPNILQLLQDLLTRHNFKVIRAQDGYNAIKTMKAEANDISYVVLDIKMPGMDGKKVFKALKEIKPDLRILIASSYEQDAALQGIQLGKKDDYIQKPFLQKDLIRKIRLMTSNGFN